MNPLNWKHQIALIIAAIIGSMVGEIIGFALTTHGERFGLWAFWYGYSSLVDSWEHRGCINRRRNSAVRNRNRADGEFFPPP